jgi:predicted acylesterase/phospholipase RssA
VQTEVVVALVGLAGSSLGSLAGVVASAKLTAYRLEQLEKKVDKHNTVIERTYKLEETQAVMEEQIKVANHRIADLEENQKEN